MEKGWNKYAPFGAKGGFNRPYILLKAKNVVDPEVRRQKWMKARPIAPGTKHPMRRLLGYVGRAWAFVTARMEGQHFVIHHGGQVPKFLEEASQLGNEGDVGVVVKDIEGCYPAMPKAAIRFGLRNIVADIKRTHGYEGVTVPMQSTKACGWKKVSANESYEKKQKG